MQAVSRTMSDHLCSEWCDLKKSWESRGKVCCTKNQIIKKICWTNLHRIFLHYLIVTTPGAWHSSTNLKLHFSSGRCCWIGGAQQYQGSCHPPWIDEQNTDFYISETRALTCWFGLVAALHRPLLSKNWHMLQRPWKSNDMIISVATSSKPLKVVLAKNCFSLTVKFRLIILSSKGHHLKSVQIKSWSPFAELF